MRRPLRSKRAMISPVRLRAKASGLMRMRVRSIGPRHPTRASATGVAGERLERRRLLRRRRRAARAARRGRDAGDLRLAVRAELPLRVERPRAVRARVLELAHAVRAAQEVGLDLEVAVRAQVEVHRVHPRLGGLHLELALADVVEVLRRAHDHVDDRPDEREEDRRGRGAADRASGRRSAAARPRTSSTRARGRSRRGRGSGG